MKLSAPERSADLKLTELIHSEIAALNGAPLDMDNFVLMIRKKSGHLQKILADAYYEAQIRSKLRGLTTTSPFTEDQLRLFPDLAFIPEMIVCIKDGRKTLIDVMTATLCQYDQWVALQVEANRRGVERKEAHYKNFRAQFSAMEQTLGDKLTIGQLIDLRAREDGTSDTRLAL